MLDLYLMVILKNSKAALMPDIKYFFAGDFDFECPDTMSFLDAQKLDNETIKLEEVPLTEI